MRIKPAGKLIILIVFIGIAFIGYNLWGSKLAPGPKGPGTVTPGPINIPKGGGEVNDPSTGSVEVKLPEVGDPGCTDKPEVRLLHWAWNAQMGMILATGGQQATRGSLMCSHGVNLKLVRQDDVGKMQQALIAFATELSQGNPHPRNGAHFVAIMGDGSAAFLAGVNDALRRIGPEYTAKVVGAAGYSKGEDKFMGPPEWKTNPPSAMGGVVAGVLRDGDWNLAQNWLSKNGLRTNTNEKTYDPDALNWVAADTYLDAAAKYNAGYSEDRPVVRNGRPTGQTKRITVNGVVTWTPGDVNIAQQKGGLVSIVSTYEYSSQMPCTIIGINKWMRDNRPIVEGMLQAVFEGSAMFRKSHDARLRAAQISATVYNEPGSDTEYWDKYFDIVQEKDKQGLTVELGGSSVAGLGDNLILFGLTPGAANIFGTVYTVFGDLVKKQYPLIVPRYPPIAEVLDTSYLKNLEKKMKPGEVKVTVANPGPKPPSGGGNNPNRILSSKSYKIQFASGRATFTPAAMGPLKQLRDDLLTSGWLAVEIHGHTDNVGNPQGNKALSELRAFAVRDWLRKSAPVNFPKERFQIYAHGQDNPVESNTSEQGRAANRRVVINMLRSSG